MSSSHNNCYCEIGCRGPNQIKRSTSPSSSSSMTTPRSSTTTSVVEVLKNWLMKSCQNDDVISSWYKIKKMIFLGFYYIIELSYFNLRYHIQIKPVKNINKSFFHWFKIFHIWIICFKTYLNKNTFKMLRVQWVLFKGRHQMLDLWRFLIIKLVKYAGKIPKTTSAANF